MLDKKTPFNVKQSMNKSYKMSILINIDRNLKIFKFYKRPYFFRIRIGNIPKGVLGMLDDKNAKKNVMEPEEIMLKALRYICSKSFKNKQANIALDANSYNIQKFFYECKKSKKFPFLKNFHFNDDPDFPYSPEVELVLLRLQDYGYLTRPNPAYQKFNISISSESSDSINNEVDQNFAEFAKKLEESLIIES